MKVNILVLPVVSTQNHSYIKEWNLFKRAKSGLWAHKHVSETVPIELVVVSVMTRYSQEPHSTRDTGGVVQAVWCRVTSLWPVRPQVRSQGLFIPWPGWIRLIRLKAQVQYTKQSDPSSIVHMCPHFYSLYCVCTFSRYMCISLYYEIVRLSYICYCRCTISVTFIIKYDLIKLD